jgi:hypothetical protein
MKLKATYVFAFIGTAAAAVAVGWVIWLFWPIIGDPSGTMDEAVAVFRNHRQEIHRIAALVKYDKLLGWVTPGLTIELLSDRNKVIAAQSKADYAIISSVMAGIPVRDLEIIRDEQPPNELRFMRFVIFNYGWFGSTKPVLGVWIKPGNTLVDNGYEPSACRAVETDWYVCSLD